MDVDNAVWTASWLTGDDKSALGGAQAGLAREPVFGATLVRLVSVLRPHVAYVQLSRRQDQVLAIYTQDIRWAHMS